MLYKESWFREWRGKVTRWCYVDMVVDALHHIYDRIAKVTVQDCLETAPEWALNEIRSYLEERRDLRERISKYAPDILSYLGDHH